MWIAIFSALSAIVCLGCLVGTLFAARNASHAQESLRRRLRSCESTTQSVITSQAEWQEVVANLANQVKMTKVRKALNHTDRDKGGEPDAKSDPEGWRAWKNAQLRAGVYNQ